MDDPNDVRTHRLESKVLLINIEMRLYFESEQPAFLSQLGDELSELLTQRIRKTPGVVHLETPNWDITLGT
jgi:hypothetical protein